MAYDEYLHERIEIILNDKKISFRTIKMMGGICFMVNDKMCLGIINDNLMARVGPDLYDSLLVKEGARPMDFTKRPMKGYLYVSPEAIDFDKDLEFWINQCLAFNPCAKSSKKK